MIFQLHYQIVLVLLFCSLPLLSCAATSNDLLIFAAPQAKLIDNIDDENLDHINTIVQTNQGHIWLGTDQGLIKYDGYHTKRFIPQLVDTARLNAAYITDMVTDHQQNLWIATQGGGLSKFAALDETFHRMAWFNTDPNQKSNVMLNAIVIDNHQLLWIASDQGLKIFDTRTEMPQFLPDQLNLLKHLPIKSLTIDSLGNIWVITVSQGIYRLSQYNQMYSIKHFDHQQGVKIIEDQQQRIWLGTRHGLYAFDRLKQCFIPQTKAASEPLNDISTLIADPYGNIWLGTHRSGVIKFTPAQQRYQHLSGQANTQHQFNSDHIFTMYIDQQYSLWIATRQGLIQVTNTARQFEYISNNTHQLNITDIDVLPDRYVTFAANHRLYQWHPQQSQLEKLHINGNKVIKVNQNKQDGIWLVSLEQGLQHYNRHSQQLVQIEVSDASQYDAPIVAISDLLIDHDNQLWIFPLPNLPERTGGIHLYQPLTNHYQVMLNGPLIRDMISINESQWLVVSDTGELMQFDPTRNTLTPWAQHASDTPKQTIDVYRDSHGNLWFATASAGLARYVPEKDAFIYITTHHGLHSNRLVSLMEDQQGYLWLGSQDGLSRYHPLTKEVVNFNRHNGLLFNRFSQRTVTKDAMGKLYFGSEQGLMAFDPLHFIKTKHILTVFITDFKLQNQTVNWQQDTLNHPLTKPIEFTKKIVLEHPHYAFAFSFGTNDYVQPEKITYAYQLQGLDEQWIYTNSDNRVASYTTLAPDDYLFKVKAKDQYGNWSANIAEVAISISPRWWLSWPAYLSYGLLVGLISYALIYRRSQKSIRYITNLEQQLKLRGEELLRSRDQVTELLEQKRQLFASVSHEFRTPLTLILSPVEHLLGKEKGQAITNELQMIKRNSYRLLRMVDQLLEFAKLDGHRSDRKVNISLKQTLEIIVSSFQLLVKHKHISLSMPEFQDVMLTMLPDSLNNILINILSNAFKYSCAGATIMIEVTQQHDQVSIAITDTGVGISEQDLEAVFQRFNRAKQGHTEVVPGAGIGLALVKELVEANGGTIKLHSVIGVGSTFIVTLPCSKKITNIIENEYQQEMVQAHLDLEIDSIQTSKFANEQQLQLDRESTSKPIILIVSDNNELRNLLTVQLGNDYLCHNSENGQLGLDFAKVNLPDLVISDVIIPLIDGFQLTALLKNDPITCHIPVILLAAKSNTSTSNKESPFLADEYLAKPFSIAELKECIHNILSVREIIKQKYKQAIELSNLSLNNQQHTLGEMQEIFIYQVNQQLASNHMDSEFSAKTLAQGLEISELQLQQKLKAQFDIGFSELMCNYRLNRAVDLLKEGKKASQVYDSVGFSSHAYFSNCFKAKFDQTPKMFQQQYLSS